jgi:membrane protease YdiL (CAAX protease family)
MLITMTKKQKSNTVRWVEFGLLLLVVLSGIFLQFQKPLYNFLTGVVLFGLTIYFLQRNFTLFGPSLFFFLAYLVSLMPIARLGLFFLLPLIVYVVIMGLYPKLRQKSWFFKVGKPGRNTWILGLVTVIVSSTALYLWVQFSNVNIDDIKAMMPNWSMWTLILLGIVFAVVNSIVEESIYRGILYDCFKGFIDSRVIVIVLQAAIFGLAHWQGFPRGVSGVALSFVYGLFLGAIRHRSHGLLAPMIVHVAADFTIFLLILGEIGKL